MEQPGDDLLLTDIELQLPDADDEIVDWEPLIEVAPDKFVRGQQADDVLHLSCARKESPTGWYQTKDRRWVPELPNSFGLLASESCPGETPFCAPNCYAARTENRKGVYEAMKKNLEKLKAAGSIEQMADLLREMVGRFWAECDQQDISPALRIFRIHWDGDFFSEDYARAWKQVITEFPDVSFWAYTRSFTPEANVVPTLVNIDNLSIYISVDAWNIDYALGIASNHPSVALAICAEDEWSCWQLYRLFGERGRPRLWCPENNKANALELMQEDSQANGNGIGACAKCLACVRGNRDVFFTTTGKQYAGQSPRLPLDVAPQALQITKRPKQQKSGSNGAHHPQLFVDELS
jgi:hypothetical protein